MGQNTSSCWPSQCRLPSGSPPAASLPRAARSQEDHDDHDEHDDDHDNHDDLRDQFPRH